MDKPYSEMTKDELEQEQLTLETKLQSTLNANDILTNQIFEIDKELKTLEVKVSELKRDKEPLKQAKSKGTYNRSVLESKLREVKPYIYKRLRGE